MNGGVFKEWLYELPYRMQSVLVSSLRGCDMAKKDDPSKYIQRGLRGVILNNADPSNSFIIDDIPDHKQIIQFLWDIDAYPMHYVMHTAHAAEIIGYKHQNSRISVFWEGFYKDVCKGLHVNFETEEQLDVRLGFTPVELEVRKRLEATEEKNRKKEIKAAVKELEAKQAKTLKKEIKAAVKEAKHEWDAGTGTSHGDRDRDYSGSS